MPHYEVGIRREEDSACQICSANEESAKKCRWYLPEREDLRLIPLPVCCVTGRSEWAIDAVPCLDSLDANKRLLNEIGLLVVDNSRMNEMEL